MLIILLVGMVSTEAMAEPVQEQKECTNPRCPNVNIGPGQTLPSFLSGRGGVRVPVYGGGFVPGTSVTPGTEVSIAGRVVDSYILDIPADEVLLPDFASNYAGGQAVDWNLQIILPPGGVLEIQGKPGEIPIPPDWASRAGGPGGYTGDIVFNMPIIPPELVAHWSSAPAGDDLENINDGVLTTGTEIIIQLPPGWAKNTASRGTGNIYINTAYGTTQADVPICDFCINYGYGISVWVDVETNVELFARPGKLPEGTNIPANIDFSLGGSYDPFDVLSVYSTQKGVRTLQPEPEFSLHYDSGKADGTVDECQTILGYGWTHNYNIYLIDRSPDIFMADGKGRMTRFQEDGMGGYTSSDGQTHTLISAGPDIFILEEVDGSSMVFQLSFSPPPWAGSEKIYLLVGIQDARGRTTELSYDFYSLLKTITDSYGRSTQLLYADYFGKPLLQTVISPDMYITTIMHDPAGERLQSVTDPQGNSLTYGYDGSGRMTTAQLKDGNTWTCQYNSGVPQYIKDPNDDVYVTITNSNNWARDISHPDSKEYRYLPSVTTITDGEGNITTFDLDENGYVTAVGHPGYPDKSFMYDGNLRLTEITDQAGNCWQYEYDANGNLTDVNDPLANHTERLFEHPTIGSLCTKMIEADGDIWQFEWNSKGDLTKVIDPIVESPTDKVINYSYTYYPVPPYGRFQTVTRTDRNDSTKQWEFDPNGNIVRSVVDPCGLALTTEYEYDAVGRVTKRTVQRDMASSLITTYSYDPLGRVIERTVDPDSLGLATEYEYDGCGRIIKVTNPRGISTDYDYDIRGRLVTRTFDPCDLVLTTNYSYDGCDKRIRSTNARGNITNYEYDSLNRLVRIVDAEGYRTEYEYDNRSNLTFLKRTIDPGGGPYRITKYEYDPLNRLIQLTADPCDSALSPEPNLVTEYSYDAANRLIKQVVDPCDANLVTSYSYDGTGSIISQTTSNGNVISYCYDAANRLTNISDSIGQVAGYSYDENSNIISRSDGLDHTWTYFYDNADRVTDVCDPLVETPTDKYTTYEYDKNNNLIKGTDNEALVTDYEYDSLNRLISTTKDPCGLNITTTVVYDGFDNKISAAGDNGNATNYEYDGLNRLIREEFADGTEMLFGYDGVGNLINETDQMDNATGYSYDDLNRLITRSYADGKADTFGYDRAGQLLTADNDISHIGYTYDGAGHTISTTQTDLPETYNYAVGYAYTADPNNTRTITYSNGNEVTEFYDVRNRLIKVKADSNTIALYTYDDPGNRLLTKNFDNGTQSLYSYNDNDWVTKLLHKAPDDSNLAGFEYAYDAVGNCINSCNLLTYDAGKPVNQSLTFDYDPIYRLNEFKRGLYIGGTFLLSTRHSSWILDGANNWQQFSIQDTIDASENGTYTNSINQMNEYDDPSTNDPAPVPDDDGQPDDFMVNANPLEGDLQPDGDVDFNDLAVIASHWLDQDCILPGSCGGADLDDSNDVDLIDFAFLADNWLDSTPGFYNSSHDKNGNLVNDDVAEYFWDYDHRSIDTAVLRAKNLLTQVKRKSDGQVLGEYLYDALGRRISKTVGTVTTVFVYDGWRVISEYDDSISTSSFIYGDEIDEVLVVLDASAIPSHYHADIKGSTIAITDAAAAVSERYTYDAYGRPYFCDADGNLLTESAVGNSYLFTGRRYDKETGLYYYRTRYLHPQRGRFISGDVIGNWGDLSNLGNGYTYVANNPVNYTDPFGLQAGVKFGHPRGPKRKRYNFRFKASSVNGKWIRKATIIISSRDALRLRKGTPAAEVLRKCKVIIISGGAANIKKG